jgi:trimeric autotransporter adhesin
MTFSSREGGFDVIVGGPFLHAGDVEAQRIARWDGTAWSPLGAGLATTPSALAAANGIVYAATHDEGTSGRLLLGRFDGTSWVDIATPANGLGRPFELTTHTFTALEARGDVLLAAGSLWTEDGARNAFVYQDGTFRALGGGVGALSVDAIEAGPDGIVVGGAIAEAGASDETVPSIGIAHFRL